MIGKKLLLVFGLAILVVLGLLLMVFKTRVTYLGRATEDKHPSLSRSYLFASPLVAQSGGENKINISAFLLNEQDRGVSDQEIQITSSPPLDINPLQSKTDKYGQAVFEVASAIPGQFIVSAFFSGQPFPQTVTLTFR